MANVHHDSIQLQCNCTDHKPCLVPKCERKRAKSDWKCPSRSNLSEQAFGVDGVSNFLHHGQSLSPCPSIESQPQVRAQCLDKPDEQCLKYCPHKLQRSS